MSNPIAVLSPRVHAQVKQIWRWFQDDEREIFRLIGGLVFFFTMVWLAGKSGIFFGGF